MSLSIARSLFEPFDEPPQNLDPDLVLRNRVLDAVLEVRIVVHFHHHETRIGLLDVDTIEPFADRLCSTHRNVDDLSRRLVEAESTESALARGAVRTMLDDLPVTARHSVLADKQRLAAEHTDS